MVEGLSILVLSCDNYSDLWDTFFDCFERFWPDCPYNIYLGSNTVSYNRKHIEVLYSGPDKDWSSTAKSIIAQVPTKYLWVFLEDIFITSRIHNSQISNIVNFMGKTKAKHVHEKPLPKPDRYTKTGFGVYQKGAPYRVNVRGFWEKSFLLYQLIEGESPWNFEIMGSYRSSYYDGFYCLTSPICQVLNGVEKGYLHPTAVKWCRNNGIHSIDRLTRAGLTYHRRVISSLKQMYFNLVVKLVPWRLRVGIMGVLRKLLVSY
ncbi:MAG: hypothetical protein JRI96_10950 [Deltaproteobacteria bacterium]|nr:hypothetical protein [Deltaproteobacteria bacterium]